MSKVGIVWDNRYLLHETGPGHPESPERLLAVKEVLDQHPSFVSLKPRLATNLEVGLIHHADHVQAVASRRGQSGNFDLDTPFSAGSTEAAFLAAGGVLECVEKVDAGIVASGFAFPRPPGHHAEATHAMGFCLFNNIAIAAAYLIHKKNKKRVAIMDFDVHHGNGTQHAFYDRSDVFYVSTHRYPFYPGTGRATEIGEGEGRGYTLNLPYTALADDDDYAKGFAEKIIPALEAYQPDFILVSAGFDAHERDPLGGMRITKAGFRMMSGSLFSLAKKHCGGKIVFVLEGGYDMKGLQEGVESVFEVIS